MKAVYKIRSWVGYSFTQNLKEISLGWGMKELKVFHCKLVLINRETYFELTHNHTHGSTSYQFLWMMQYISLSKKCVLILLKSNFYKENKPQSFFFFNNTYFNFFVFLTRHNKLIYKIDWVKGY